MPSIDPVQELKAEDNLISHLREFITGPEAKLAEARYEEFLNILAEQKDYADALFTRFDVNFQAAVSELQGQIALLNEDVRGLSLKLEGATLTSRQNLEYAIQNVREDHVVAIHRLAAAEKNAARLENEILTHLGQLTESFNAYAGVTTKQRDEDLASMMNAIQQVASGVRSELNDRVSAEVSEVGAALAAVGKRIQDKTLS